MQLRRSARLLTVAGALLLAAPVLTSCGFDYATDRVYTPGAGVNDRDASVDVLSAVVVSAHGESGTLVASFANNDDDSEATVQDIKGAGDSSSLKIKGFSPIQIPAGGLVNLADADTPINISGDFTTGDFVTLSFTFDDDQTIEMQIPTVTDCYEYEGLDQSTDSPTPADECAQEAPVAEEH